MEFILVLLFAYGLDLLFGDPKKMPHLIVAYGNFIAFGEKKLNKGKAKFYKGAFWVLACFLVVTVFYSILVYSLNYFSIFYLSVVVKAILLFYCLANKTLVDEGKAVINTLKKEGLEAGRKRLSWIVGRDTSELSEQQIKKATFETMSENLSDGVIAPLFYFLCFGVYGALVYKMINTLDSMIGYKSERYEQFGKFAAKLDDVVNYIPARLTAVIMLLVTLKIKGLSFVFTEGKKHSSPNAGYPEAALAYILDCSFGGPNTYFGELVKKPFIGSNHRKIEFSEIEDVTRVNHTSTLFFVVVMLCIFVCYEFF